MTSLVVRQAVDSEAPAVRSLLLEAFGASEGEQVASVVDDLAARGQLEALLVAERGAALVGVVGLSAGWLDARQRLVDVAVLSPLAVLPAAQGQGVGAALLEAAERHAEQSGFPLVFLEGDPGYYSARGWLPAASAGLERPSDRIPERACQARLLSARETWMTGRLVYPDAWWQRDLVGLRDPVLAEVEADIDAP